MPASVRFIVVRNTPFDSLSLDVEEPVSKFRRSEMVSIALAMTPTRQTSSG